MKSLLFPILILIVFLQSKADQWVAQTSGTANNLYSVDFPSGDTGYVSGAGGTLLRTLNGGNAWTPLTSGTTQPLFAVVTPDKVLDTAYAVGGNGTILKTTNRGNNWTAQASGTTAALRFAVAHGSLALAGGDSGVLVRTNNGGATWTRGSTGTSANLYSLGVSGGDSANSVVTMLVTSANGIIKSLDTGKTWSAVSITSPPPLYAVQLINSIAFAVGGSGAIFKSTNVGTSWTSISSGVTQQLNSVIFPDSNNIITNPGYIVGAGGFILKTITTGSSWTAQTSGTTQNLNAITFPHGNNISGFYAYVVGNGGVILKGNISTTPVLRIAKTGDRFGITKGGTLWYNLSVASPVEALLFDAGGRLLFKIGESRQVAGHHEVPLPPEAVSGASLLEFRAEGIRGVLPQ